MDSVAKLKAELRKRKDISHVPKHYEIGPRKLNIILTQLRCFASFLNYDLFQVNIVSGRLVVVVPIAKTPIISSSIVPIIQI